MLLYGGETHGVEGCEPGNGVLADRDAADDVTPGGIGERLEKAVKFGLTTLIYNHLVVRYSNEKQVSMGFLAAVPNSTAGAVRSRSASSRHRRTTAQRVRWQHPGVSGCGCLRPG